MNETLAKLKIEADKIRAELSASVLDGTPFLLALISPQNDNMPLLFGNLYPDQSGFPGQAFRLQRRFDLCGVLCMSKESADLNAAKANNQIVAEGRPGYVTVMHRRGWFKQELEGLERSMGFLEVACAKIS